MEETMTLETENEKLKAEINELQRQVQDLQNDNAALREIIVRMSAEKYLPR